MKFDVHCHAFPSHGFIPNGGKLGYPYFLSVEQQLQMLLRRRRRRREQRVCR